MLLLFITSFFFFFFSSCVIMDSNSDCILLSVFNLAVGKGLLLGDTVAIPEPFIQMNNVSVDNEVRHVWRILLFFFLLLWISTERTFLELLKYYQYAQFMRILLLYFFESQWKEHSWKNCIKTVMRPMCTIYVNQFWYALFFDWDKYFKKCWLSGIWTHDLLSAQYFMQIKNSKVFYIF